MGDRAMIKVGKVWFYGHWLGSECYKVVKEALEQMGDRVDDEEYTTATVARILLKDNLDGNLSFGIGTAMHWDIEHYIPEIDCEKGVVNILDHRSTKRRKVIESHTIQSFKENFNVIALGLESKR